MYCPDKLKLNKFRDVKLLSGKELFGRFGFDQSASGAYYDPEAPAQRMYQSKLDTICSVDAELRDELGSPDD